MSTPSNTPSSDAGGSAVDVDVLIVGAGFAGIRTLYETRRLGLTARVLETGGDVGGTWYWNRYPGARTDSESWVYAFCFSQELLDEWSWSERYPGQPEVERYLRHVVDRFDLRKDMRFDTHVVSAVFDEATGTWVVTTGAGRPTARRISRRAWATRPSRTGPRSRAWTASGASGTSPRGGRGRAWTSAASASR